MMADNYVGWKLFDKTTIVAKKIHTWNYQESRLYDTGEVQGYVVDPSNKKQLTSAREWGTTYQYVYDKDENGSNIYKNGWKEKITIEPEEFTYDNKDFTLALQDAAEGSCQGGKLSFWNCWITASDGRKFLIGIAANLLLDVLKSTTVVNGVVQEKLMFARCKGGVGMLSESMNSYKDAMNDESLRKSTSKGKTTKHKIGRVYETLTEKNVYFGDFYKWYEPVYGEKETSYYPYHKANQLLGFKKLTTPIVIKWFPDYNENNSVDTYIKQFIPWQLKTKLPARKELSDVVVTVPDLNKCLEEIENEHAEHLKKLLDVQSKGMTMSCYLDTQSIGLSVDSTDYTMPKNQRELLLKLGYTIED